MSLQVWLPLNGDLTQQGLSNAIATISGVATVDNAGKIGKCYSFSGGSNCLKVNYGNNIPANNLSISCWAYIVANSHNKIIFGVTNGSNQRLYVGIQSDYYQLAYGAQSWGNTPQIAKATIGEWHHIAISIDNNVCSMYYDGTFIHSISQTAFNLTSNIMIGGRDDGYTGSVKINDFRIYDHALSAREVKELAKGLVLHYRLAESPIMGMKTKSLPDGSHWARINWLDVSTVNQYFTRDEVQYCNKANRFSAMALVDQFKNSSGIYEFMMTLPKVSSTLYNRWTQTNSPNASASTGYTAITTAWSYSNCGLFKSPHDSTVYQHSASGWWQPIGQLAGWSPHIPAATGKSEDEVELWVRIDEIMPFSTIEYDCSGYKRNGIKHGNIPLVIDSPRYVTSSKVSNGKYIYCNEDFSFITTGSMSFWGKFETLGSSGWLPITGNGGAYYLMATSGGTGNFYNGTVTASPSIKYYEDGKQVNAPSSNGVWHHYCITGISLPGWNKIQLNNYSSSWNSTAKYSDLRFYNTILSAEDIAELYHSAVIVDNTGKNYAYEYFEG